MNERNSGDVSVTAGSHGNANLIYILYIVSVIVGVTSIVGVIMAYIGRGEADSVTQSHYNNQINIFWKTLLFFVIGTFTAIFLIGFLIMLAAFIWFLIRTITGMQTLSKGEAIANPSSWGFTA